MKSAVDRERGHVFLQVEGVRHVGAVENEVKGEGKGLSPIFGAGVDEVFGTQSFGILFFARGVGQGVNLSAHGGGPEDTEMAKATTTEELVTDTNFEGGPERLTCRGLLHSCRVRSQHVQEGSRP